MAVSGMGNKWRRAYPPEFRQQVVELYHAGRSTTELAQDFSPAEREELTWLRRETR